MVLSTFLKQAPLCLALQELSFSVCPVRQAALPVPSEDGEVETDKLPVFQREGGKLRKNTPFYEIFLQTYAVLAGGHSRDTRRLRRHAMVLERASCRGSIATITV